MLIILAVIMAATTRALMPLGVALGIPPQFLIAVFPSVNGYFFDPDLWLADRRDQLRPVR